MSSGVARKWGEGEHNMNFSSPPLPGISFRFRDFLNLLDRRKCITYSLVIFEIFTVKLAAAAECTEFPKLGGYVPKCPIGSDVTDYEVLIERIYIWHAEMI